jgi:hypothetical protein
VSFHFDSVGDAGVGVKLTYDEIYGKLDGIAALIVAQQTPLKKNKDERDTGFVKRIVAHYLMVVQP